MDRPTLKLPDAELPAIDLGLDADRDLGLYVADTKLHITKTAFEQTYQQGIDSFWQANGVAVDDALLGDKAASLMLEGARRGLVNAIVKSSAYSGVLLVVCFLVKLPPAAACVCIPPAVVSAVCMSKKI